MTATLTIIDDLYSANDATGRKHIFATVSSTNPYSTGGDTLTFSDISVTFPTKFLGGGVVAVNASVAAARALQAGCNSCLRADTSSTASVVLQFASIGLGGTANAGELVDNTTGNISNVTTHVEFVGY